MSEYSFNPFPLFRRAATGDLEAMRQIASKGSAVAWENQCESSMSTALVFARLAYLQTGDRNDGVQLLYVLAMCSALREDGGLQDEARAEAIALLESADLNVDFEAGLFALISDTSPDVIALAQQIAAMMKEDCQNA